MNAKVNKIMDFYNQLSENEDYTWVRWNDSPIHMTIKDANKYFIGVMLDQGQTAERAWAGGRHFVDTYYNNRINMWQDIIGTSEDELNNICNYGFNGKSYAVRYSQKKFPYWLRDNAYKIVNEFNDDPRNIWDVENHNLIYRRFKSFDGIGDALAKMALFILVRKYGIAGGIENRSCLSVKPDIHVCKVMYRMGISGSKKIGDVKKSINRLHLESPADFDAATWVIGQEYCKKTNPKCHSCPVKNVCNFAQRISHQH